MDVNGKRGFLNNTAATNWKTAPTEELTQKLVDDLLLEGEDGNFAKVVAATKTYNKR